MFSGYQSSGYQRNAYQINGGVVKPWTGGGPIDDNYYDRIKRYRAEQALLAKELKEAEERLAREKSAQEALRLEQLRREELILSAKDEEILRLQALAEQAEINQLLAMIAQLKAKLRFARIQEEDVLIILMTLPFKQ